MKKTYILLLATLFGALTACSKTEEPAPAAPATTNLLATINSPQQVPVNPSTATGSFTGRYESGAKQLSYTITYQGFTPTVAHIHLGAPGVNGLVAIPFANLTSPITGTVTLTDSQVTALLNNGMYVNMHSSAYPNGEIRGDIRK